MTPELTRYQEAVLDALVVTDSAHGLGVTAQRVAAELVGTQTAASVRRILNRLVTKGYAVVEWDGGRRIYAPTARGIESHNTRKETR